MTQTNLKIQLPKNSDNSQDSVHEFTLGEPIVVLGSNGAGKTRFSVKVEELNDFTYKNDKKENHISVHRIASQKILSIPKDLAIKGKSLSENKFFRGTYEDSSQLLHNKLSGKYNNAPFTKPIDDYEFALSLLFARANGELQEQRNKERKEIGQKQERSFLDETVTEKVEKIWNNLLPNREISLNKNEVNAFKNGNSYHGNEMSDGEKIALYFIIQVLLVKPSTLIIIDEPELHVHKAILNKLWDLLEKHRPDCVFMYITHDLDFATSRNTSNILWIKEFDGIDQWDYEFLNINDNNTPYNELPSELLFELIGAKKNIIFTEGTYKSLDYRLYKEIYKNSLVIPCGGCQQVITYTKAKKVYEKLGSIQVYGIIDRDFRSEHEIQKLKKDNIFCLEVAEVENLFIIPDLLKIACELFGEDDNAFDKAKSYLMKMYNDLRENQIKNAVLSELKFKLSTLNITKLEIIEIENQVKIIVSEINDITEKAKKTYKETEDLNYILKVLNHKLSLKDIGNIFGLKPDIYQEKILRFLGKKEQSEKIIAAFAPYLPELN